MSLVPPSDRFATAGSEGEEKGKAATAAVRAVETTTRLERKCMLAVEVKITVCRRCSTCNHSD